MSIPNAGTAEPLFAGKYRLERQIGAGGMGVVWVATHVALEQRVAIKLMKQDAQRDKTAVARFMREARAAARITSEHVVRIHDVATLADGTPFIAMEYVEGESLDALLEKAGPLRIDLAAEYVSQACIAVGEAHRAGIVHRDLKPANLLITRRSNGSILIKVLDFGISKIMATHQGSEPVITTTTSLIGSPVYMSPEQLTNSRDVDERADIWALGVVLFELLTGEAPFRRDTVAELCASIMSRPPRDLKELRVDAPPGLCSIVTRCLEKDPANRYASVGELADALLAFTPVRRASSPELPPPASGLRTGSVSWSSGAVHAPKSGRRAMLIAITAALCLLIGGVVVWQVETRSATTASDSRVSPPIAATSAGAAHTSSITTETSVDAALPTASAPSAPNARPTAPSRASPATSTVAPSTPQAPPPVKRPPVDDEFGGRR